MNNHRTPGTHSICFANSTQSSAAPQPSFQGACSRPSWERHLSVHPRHPVWIRIFFCSHSSVWWLVLGTRQDLKSTGLEQLKFYRNLRELRFPWGRGWLEQCKQRPIWGHIHTEATGLGGARDIIQTMQHLPVVDFSPQNLSCFILLRQGLL